MASLTPPSSVFRPSCVWQHACAAAGMLFITLSVHDAIGSGTLAKYREWPSWPICGFLQIADELKTHFNADALEQVRLIRDKRTGGCIMAFFGRGLSDNVIQVNRGSLLLQSLPR